DRDAKRFIKKNGEVGDCDFCDARGVSVIWPRKLKEIFEELLGMYRPYEEPSSSSDYWGGSTLAECLESWEIFSERLEEDDQNSLLDDIMGCDPRDGDISASDDWESEDDHWSVTAPRHWWNYFAEHVKRFRRFIIEEDSSGEIMRPDQWIEEVITGDNAIRIITPNTKLYRGRIISRTEEGKYKMLPPSAMGAPPASQARAGRANPEGISMLYAAMDPETATIETGRFPGAVACVREVRSRERLRLADFTKGLGGINPLSTSNLRVEVRNATLRRDVSDALAEPIHPNESPVEYVPTQYLAEAISAAGFDGICYRSALNPKGKNIVLFDPAKARVSRVGYVAKVTEATYKTVIARRGKV
ncbi:MAG: RES domain-containing protein, partial [Chthoniobacterales bacterium]